MSDEELIERFENCTLAGKDFHHRDHVRMVWLYLRGNSVLETLGRFSAGLKRFASANGKPNLYHETITWAYVFLIHERMMRNGSEHGWAKFVEANADLFGNYFVPRTTVRRDKQPASKKDVETHLQGLAPGAAPMFDHLSVGVRDLTAARRFYDAFFAPLGCANAWVGTLDKMYA